MVSDWAEILRQGIAGARPSGVQVRCRLWLPTDDDIYVSLFGPQRLAHRMFGRINPHWYLDGSDN